MLYCIYIRHIHVDRNDHNINEDKNLYKFVYNIHIDIRILSYNDGV